MLLVACKREVCLPRIDVCKQRKRADEMRQEKKYGKFEKLKVKDKRARLLSNAVWFSAFGRRWKVVP